MATTDLVTSKINYTLTEKGEISTKLGLNGNPTWNKIKAQINNVKLATHLVFSSDSNHNYTVSWTAPDNSYIPASKSLSISYLIYVNNIYVGETTSTSYNITNYLQSGENIVEIQVKFTMNNDKKSEKTITIYEAASVNGITCSTYHLANNTNYVKRAGLIYNNNNGFTQDSSSSLSSSNYTRKITLNATTPTLAVSDEEQSSLGFSFEEYVSDESNISVNDGFSYHIEKDSNNKLELTIYDWDNGTYSSITTDIENYYGGKILAKYDGKLIIRTTQYIDSQWVYGYYIINATSGIIVDYYQDTEHTTSSKYAYLSNGIVFDGKLYVISGFSSSKIYQIDLSTKVITEVYDLSVDSIFFNFTANGTQVYLSKFDDNNFLIIGRDSNANTFKVLQFDTITNNYTSVYSDNLSSQWYGWKFWDFSKYVYVLNDSYSLLITKFFTEVE